ncbi:RNase H domain-containing protein [Trichonephila clavipes]|nr:RNase H domain-containing protein [Trichonephila clavipes]
MRTDDIICPRDEIVIVKRVGENRIELNHLKCLQQLALEIRNCIPEGTALVYTDGSKDEDSHSGGATLVYTDGSKDEESHSGSGALIKDANGIVKIKKRSPDFSSIFKSELVPIDEGLSYILPSLDPMSIRILSNSLSALQHLSNWSSVGDKTEDSILNKLKQVSTSYDVHFQWISSHADIWGSEEADALAKEGAREALALYTS